MSAYGFEGVANEYYTDQFDPASDPTFGTDTAWFAEHAEELATNNDALVESLPAITRIPEQAFVELAARLYLIAEGAQRALGTICWQRLRETLGFEQAKESKARNEQVGRWAAQINPKDDRLFFRLQNWIRDAMAREFDARVGDMPVTAGSELALGIDSDNEDVVKGTVEQRVEAVRGLDPLGEQSVEAVRAAKQLERNGNYRPKVFLSRAANTEPTQRDYTLFATVRVGSTHDENGELHDEYETMPVCSLVLEEPPSEELRDQFTDWWKVVKNKWKYMEYVAQAENADESTDD